MTAEIAGRLFSARMRGMVADMFSVARMAPPPSVMAKIEGAGDFCIRELAEIADDLGLYLEFSIEEPPAAKAGNHPHAGGEIAVEPAAEPSRRKGAGTRGPSRR